MTTVAPSGRLGVAGVPVAKVASNCCGFRANIGTIWNTSDPLIATTGMGEGFPHPVWVKRDPPVVISAQSSSRTVGDPSVATRAVNPSLAMHRAQSPDLRRRPSPHTAPCNHE